MKYSRRDFLKDAGSGAVALTTLKAVASPLAILTPLTKGTGKVLRGEEEIA